MSDETQGLVSPDTGTETPPLLPEADAPPAIEEPPLEEPTGEEEAPETVEVEIDGVKYTVPKAVEGHLLREEDYTQKTQSLAEQRREAEAYQQQLAERAELQEAVLEERAQLRAFDTQLAEYQKIDWPAYQLQNPNAAQYHYMQYQQLQGFRNNVAMSLDEKMQQVSRKRQEHDNAVVEKTITALSKPDPAYGWTGYSPDNMRRLSDAVEKELGLSKAQQSRIVAPESIKILNLALIGKQSLKKAAAGNGAQHVEAQPVRQIPANRGRRAPSASGDEKSVDQWRRDEETRLSKKAASLRR